MPEKSDSFTQDFDFVHNESLKILPCPCDPNHHFSLDDTYMNYDLRESYLTRQSASLSNKAESIIIKNDDYETMTINVWRSNDSDIYDRNNDNLPAPTG